MKASFKILIVVLVASLLGPVATGQYYSNRNHNEGTDTLWVYNSWNSVFYAGPDTMAVNPNVEYYSPFNIKFKVTEKNNKILKKMVEKTCVVTSIGDSVWMINSRYLRDSLSGPYNRVFENHVPLYFNQKIAFVQFINTDISMLPYEIDTFEGLWAGVGRYGIFDAGDYGYVAVPHFVIDFDRPTDTLNAEIQADFVFHCYVLFTVLRINDLLSC